MEMAYSRDKARWENAAIEERFKESEASKAELVRKVADLEKRLAQRATEIDELHNEIAERQKRCVCAFTQRVCR